MRTPPPPPAARRSTPTGRRDPSPTADGGHDDSSQPGPRPRPASRWLAHAAVGALAAAVLAAALLSRPGRASPAPAASTTAADALWRRPMTDYELERASTAARTMYETAYDAYMQHAFPHDDLRPLSCSGRDTQGGVGLTALDSLTTALVLGDAARLAPAVAWAGGDAHHRHRSDASGAAGAAQHHHRSGASGGRAPATPAPHPPLSFDVDARVHTFEVTIRALGALVSTHAYLERARGASATTNPLAPVAAAYSGGLLAAAVDLADRLLPAFDTPTGVPLAWTNLASGPVPGDTRITCTACAGTLTLEFGALSHASGNATYAAAASRAAAAVTAAASRATGLVGNTLSVDSGAWTRRDAGVGAGVDSYIEYLLKAYLHTGDAASLAAFTSAYAAVMRHLSPPRPRAPGAPTAWRVDADMDTGARASPWVSSLGAFWPGLQALAGQRADAAACHADWAAAWARFGGLPEALDVGGTTRHPTLRAYPLRPELAESSFYLHAATGGHPVYRATGAMIADTLAARAGAPCGYAALADVATGARDDAMESFFVAETVKYLYLLFTPGADAAVDAAVWTTEGHPLPPVPGGPADAAVLRAAAAAVPPNSTCAFLCAPLADDPAWAADTAAAAASALPALAPTADDVALLRGRRCAACVAVDAAMQPVRADAAAADAAAAEAARPLAQAVCRLAAVGENAATADGGGEAGLACASLEPVPAGGVPIAIDGLPRDALVVQILRGAGGGAGSGAGGDGDAPPARGYGGPPPSTPPPAQQTADRGDDDGGAPAAADDAHLVSLHVTAEGTQGEALVDLSLSGLAASFGPRLPAGTALAGVLVTATPPSACAALDPRPPPGAVVAIDRGGCTFEAKVAAVAAAGGGAAVVLSDEDEHMTMGPAVGDTGGDGDDDSEDDCACGVADGDSDDDGACGAADDGDGAAVAVGACDAAGGLHAPPASALVPSLLLPSSQAASLRAALAAAGDATPRATLRPAAAAAAHAGAPRGRAVNVLVPPRTARWLAGRHGDVRAALAGVMGRLTTSSQLAAFVAAAAGDGR